MIKLTNALREEIIKSCEYARRRGCSPSFPFNVEHEVDKKEKYRLAKPVLLDELSSMLMHSEYEAVIKRLNLDSENEETFIESVDDLFKIIHNLRIHKVSARMVKYLKHKRRSNFEYSFCVKVNNYMRDYFMDENIINDIIKRKEFAGECFKFITTDPFEDYYFKQYYQTVDLDDLLESSDSDSDSDSDKDNNREKLVKWTFHKHFTPILSWLSLDDYPKRFWYYFTPRLYE